MNKHNTARRVTNPAVRHAVIRRYIGGYYIEPIAAECRLTIDEVKAILGSHYITHNAIGGRRMRRRRYA